MEFIIVDDASSDGCCEGLDRFADEEQLNVCVTVLRLDRWAGIPMARNLGAARARAPILFITDANVQACERWDVPVFRDLQGHSERALCATIADKGSPWRGFGCSLDLTSMTIRWLRGPRAAGSFVPISPCTGTALHTDLYRRLGGYDTAMPIYGAAEPEFSVRLWLYGGDILNCPDLVLSHRFRSSEERQPFLDQIAAIQIQNYIRFGLLYLDGKGIDRMMEYWSSHAPQFPVKNYRDAAVEGVRLRRRHLSQRLPYDFAWYLRRFQLQ